MESQINVLVALGVIIAILFYTARSSTQVTAYGAMMPPGRVNSHAFYDQYLIAAIAKKALPSDDDCKHNVGLETCKTRVLLAKAHQIQERNGVGMIRQSDREAFSNVRRRLLMRGVRISGSNRIYTSHPFLSYHQFQQELAELEVLHDALTA